MEAIILPTIGIAAGIYFGFRNLRMLRNDDALRQYIQSSPKAAPLVARHGVEEAMKIARKTSIPLGLVVAVALLSIGLWNLSMVIV